MYVQLTLEDTPAFRDLQAKSTPAEKTEKSPVLEVIQSNPKQILLAAGAFLAVQVTFYIVVAFLPAYGANPDGLNLSRNTMLAAVLISSFVQIPTLFWAAAYSDKHGRRGIYMAGAILGGLFAFAMFPLIDTGNFWLIVLAMSGAQVFLSLMYGPQAAFLTELFSTKVRYSGASLGYQLGAILGGAMTPIIATALWSDFGAFYISVYICLLYTSPSPRDS